ncbi:MAG: hypothetical protein AVDCRST_MAG72-722, partial [uncultured Nocardioidaceae bacterium]
VWRTSQHGAQHQHAHLPLGGAGRPDHRWHRSAAGALEAV